VDEGRTSLWSGFCLSRTVLILSASWKKNDRFSLVTKMSK